MIRRLCIIAALSLAVIGVGGSDRGVSVAYAADTYSLEDTATVVVIHPDSLDALAEIVGEVPSRVETVTVSNFPTATVGTVSLAEDERGVLGFLAAASVLIVGCVGVLVGRAVAA